MDQNKYEGFYEALVKNVTSYRGKLDEVIFYAPNLFKLLTNLLESQRINKAIRLKISAAIAYFVAPRDVIPEEVYGPLGYIDDIFISSYVLLQVKKMYGWGLLSENWEGAEPIEKILENIFKKSKEMVKGKEDEILRYVGLK